MCEIFALDSQRIVRANTRVAEFFRDSPWNPHGWGVAWHNMYGELLVSKEPLCAADSDYLEYCLEEPIRTSRLIAHIRNATRGETTFDNCHPFRASDASGRTWIIAHNGTILNTRMIEGYDQWIVGDTDSEQVSLMLMDRMNEALEGRERLTFDERFEVLEDVIAELSEENKVNLAIDDGEYLYMHTNTTEHTMYSLTQGATMYFCTRPLDEDEPWKPLSHCRLLAYRNGRLVRAGHAHDNSFDDAVYLRIIELERQRAAEAAAQA